MYCISRSFRQPLFILLFLSVFCPILFSQEVINLEAKSGRYSLGRYLYLLEDPAAELTIKEIARKPLEEFTLYTGNEPNIGFTGSAYWVKFHVQNNAPDQEWILEHAYPPMDRIELYSPDGTGSYTVLISGDNLALSERPIRHYNFLFPFKPSSEITEYYMRFRSQSAMVMSLKIWSKQALIERDSSGQLLLGAYFGLLLIMILYNLLIYISARENSYLHYILFVTSHLLFQLCMTGLAALYLWSKNPWWTNHALLIFASLSVIFSITFTMMFLQTKKYAPRLHLILNILLGVSIVSCLLSIITSYAFSIIVTNSLLMLVSVFAITSAVIIYRKGYRPARFYLIAWCALAAAVFITALKNFGMVPSNFWTTHSLKIGSALEVSLLSFALADRINVLSLEKDHAETERLKAVEEKLYTDNLTALPNRNSLLLDIEGMSEPNLFIINADHFREINDFYGCMIGNIIIIELGKRIKNCGIRNKFKVYKLHADEFALTINSLLKKVDKEQIAGILHAQCQSKPFSVDNNIIHLDVSIGVASGKDNLLEKADMSLAQARKSNKNFKIYDPATKLVKQYETNLKWISITRESLKHNRVFPCYQPIINNLTKQIEKYETLMRMQDHNGDTILPGVYLPIAKKSKLYPELSRTIIRKSFETFHPRPEEFSINLSIDDILDTPTLELIRRCLDDYNVKGRAIFEILESEGIECYEPVSRFIEEMKRRGCKIAIDDFGAGYSNFDHILRLNVDYLKLDASLIKNIHTDKNSQYVVETIVAFAKKLNIKTIAEFVHCSEVFERVKSIGIDYSQGFFLGKPQKEIT
jgi:diguanylate cyclase (GGDEF)-like protein